MESILSKYDEPNRHYHNREHITNMLDGLSDIIGMDDSRFKHLRVAILYHDIIYDSKSSTNEIDSIEYMYSNYDGVCDKEYIAILIEFTKYNLSVTDFVSRYDLFKYPNLREDLIIFTRLDFGILLHEDGEFQEHEEKIRKEYSHIPDDIFIIGRENVLKKIISIFGEDLGINKSSNICRILNPKL